MKSSPWRQKKNFIMIVSNTNQEGLARDKRVTVQSFEVFFFYIFSKILWYQTCWRVNDINWISCVIHHLTLLCFKLNKTKSSAEKTANKAKQSVSCRQVKSNELYEKPWRKMTNFFFSDRRWVTIIWCWIVMNCRSECHRLYFWLFCWKFLRRINRCNIS